ncbi:hypothetical protein LTR95_006575 [Oleoguttula sp. CCFEE 5521]
MASAKVLTLLELLKKILLHLDIKTLLFSQRVDRQWQAVITTSLKLQEALFFRQKPSVAGVDTLRINVLLLQPTTDQCDRWAAGLGCRDLFDITGKLLTWRSPHQRFSRNSDASALRMYLTASPTRGIGRKRLADIDDRELFMGHKSCPHVHSFLQQREDDRCVVH